MTWFLIALCLAVISWQEWRYRKVVRQGLEYKRAAMNTFRLNDELCEITTKLTKDSAAIISEFYGAGLEAYRG